MKEEEFQIIADYCAENGLPPDNLHKISEEQLERLLLEAQRIKEGYFLMHSLLDDPDVLLQLIIIDTNAHNDV